MSKHFPASRASVEEALLSYVARLSPMEQAVFCYLPDTGYRPVSGPAMSKLIRRIWRHTCSRDLHTIAVTGPRKSERAMLGEFGRNVRAALVTIGPDS